MVWPHHASPYAYASKDSVTPGKVTTYEDLADAKWKHRICNHSGTHSYILALTAAYLYHQREAETLDWLKTVQSNLTSKPQGNELRSGQSHLGWRMRHCTGDMIPRTFSILKHVTLVGHCHLLHHVWLPINRAGAGIPELQSVNHIHAFGHTPNNRILAIQEVTVCKHDKKLTVGRIRAL